MVSLQKKKGGVLISAILAVLGLASPGIGSDLDIRTSLLLHLYSQQPTVVVKCKDCTQNCVCGCQKGSKCDCKERLSKSVLTRTSVQSGHTPTMPVVLLPNGVRLVPVSTPLTVPNPPLVYYPAIPTYSVHTQRFFPRLCGT